MQQQEKQRDWFFTFGVSHEHAKRFVRLHGTIDETRERMCALFGRDWSMQYSDEQIERIATKWGLTELQVQ